MKVWPFVSKQNVYNLIKVLALCAFSRMLFVVLAVLSSQMIQAPNSREIIPLPEKDVLAQAVSKTFAYTDAYWYSKVIENGYEKIPFSTEQQRSWAFFPAYCLVVRFLGGSELAGIIFSVVCWVSGMFVLFLGLSNVYSEKTAWRTLFLVAAFPSAHFLSSFRPEGLLFCMFCMVYYCTVAKRFVIPAVLCGFIAGLTKPLGIVTGLFALPVLFHRPFRREIPEKVKAILILGAPVLGILAYSAYLHAITGNMFAWKDIQCTWGRSLNWPWVSLIRFFESPLLVGHSSWAFPVYDFLCVLLSLTAFVLFAKRKEYSFLLFIVIGMIIPMCSGTLWNTHRYLASLFPVQLAFALCFPKQLFYILMVLYIAFSAFIAVGVGVSLNAVMG